jgi:hypothetical protein
MSGAAMVGAVVVALAVSGVATSTAEARKGRVRAQGRSVADAGGQFNALGATLFWGAWGYKFDRPRLERNLEALKTAGVDYIRVLGSVGGESWEDRPADPRWPDYDAIIAGLTDFAYDRYGIRTQWTLFGGAPFTATPAVREAVVDRFAAMARGREHKIFAIEIANEAWQNGFEGAKGIAELRRLGKRLSDRTSVLVALSAPGGGALCDTYANSGVDAMTIHYPRQTGREGPAEPLLRPWTASVQNAKCRKQLPALVLNNEPIGPESSVEQDDSPSRIAGAYVMTFLAGNAAYVLHAGPGVRGGGAADLALNPPRHAAFEELPSFKAIATALSSARRYLPAGLPNWTRHAPNAANAPLHGFDGLYASTSGSRFVALAVDVGKGAAVQSRVGANITIRDAATGEVLTRLTVSPGTKIPLEGAEQLVITGRGT